MTRATAIYSDDADVRTIAAAQNITVIGLAELPVPSETVQIEMQLEPPAADEQTDAAPLDDDPAQEEEPEA